ncbi:REP-associated tyrosine transposase [Blastopirellula sediminis]
MEEHRKTLRRYEIPGDARFLTFSCFRRLPLLTRDRSRGFLFDAINSSRSQHPFDLWGYVIMPEHVHLLLWPHPGTLVGDILKTTKMSTSRQAITWLRNNAPDFLPRLEDVQPNGSRTFRFWQRGGGYDRNIDSVLEVHRKLRYVHENPVRRGLVSRTIDWPWSSALAWDSRADGLLTLDFRR